MVFVLSTNLSVFKYRIKNYRISQNFHIGSSLVILVLFKVFQASEWLMVFHIVMEKRENNIFCVPQKKGTIWYIFIFGWTVHLREVAVKNYRTMHCICMHWNRINLQTSIPFNSLPEKQVCAHVCQHVSHQAEGINNWKKNELFLILRNSMNPTTQSIKSHFHVNEWYIEISGKEKTSL